MRRGTWHFTRAARCGRQRFCEEAIDSCCGNFTSPERAIARLRVGVRRRQSAGSRFAGKMAVYEIEKTVTGKGDREFLDAQPSRNCCFNFTWWVNRKDATETTFSRAAFSASTTSASSIEARHCRRAVRSNKPTARHGCLLRARNVRDRVRTGALEPRYAEMALKFCRAYAVDRTRSCTIVRRSRLMWDEDDEFFYDVLRLPDGPPSAMRVRSLVGLMPLWQRSMVVDQKLLEHVPDAVERFREPNPAAPGVRGISAELRETRCVRQRDLCAAGSQACSRGFCAACSTNPSF